jgi:putative transcriptional regulator
MENEKLFFVHSRPGLIPDGQQIHDNLYWGGDFKRVVELIQSKQLTENDVRFYLGYCGWDTNELEEEIKEGSWHPCPFQYDAIFTSNEKNLWQEIIKKD